MAKFNPETYDPVVDSTPGAAAKYKADATHVVLVVKEGSSCQCGCKADAKPGRLFLQGHDAKLKGKLLRAHRAGRKFTVVDVSGKKAKKTDYTPSILARQFGWTGLLKAKR